MDDIEILARSVGDYIMRHYVMPWGNNIVRYYRAQVVSPAAGGKITVKRPFDATELHLPYTNAAANLTAGQQCLVLVLGDESNAVVFSDGRMQNV